KTINKNIKIRPSDTLAITNYFGNICIKTWNKNEAAVRLDITGRSYSKKRSTNIADNVFLKTRNLKNSKHCLLISSLVKTPYNGNGGVNGILKPEGDDRGMEVIVNCTVYIPEKVALTVQEYNGDVYIDTFKSKLSVKIFSGCFHFNRISGPGKRVQV